MGSQFDSSLEPKNDLQNFNFCHPNFLELIEFYCFVLSFSSICVILPSVFTLFCYFMNIVSSNPHIFLNEPNIYRGVKPKGYWKSTTFRYCEWSKLKCVPRLDCQPLFGKWDCTQSLGRQVSTWHEQSSRNRVWCAT